MHLKSRVFLRRCRHRDSRRGGFTDRISTPGSNTSPAHDQQSDSAHSSSSREACLHLLFFSRARFLFAVVVVNAPWWHGDHLRGLDTKHRASQAASHRRQRQPSSRSERKETENICTHTIHNKCQLFCYRLRFLFFLRTQQEAAGRWCSAAGLQ